MSNTTMAKSLNNSWYILWGIFALILGILSLGLDMYPQFPSMCIILGIVLAILIDTMEQVPPLHTYHWHILWDDIRSQKVSLWK